MTRDPAKRGTLLRIQSHLNRYLDDDVIVNSKNQAVFVGEICASAQRLPSSEWRTMGFRWLGLSRPQVASKAWLERWLGPTYSSGDALRVDTEIVGITPSRAKPQQGIVTVRSSMPNQHDDEFRVKCSEPRHDRYARPSCLFRHRPVET